MPTVSGFRHDVFVSYAHSDDQPVAGTERGFVSQLVADLTTEVSRKVRNDIDIWWDHSKLNGDTRVTPEIIAAAGDCPCIIIVASPAYLRSEWCDRERNAFCQRTTRQSGIFLVGLEPIDQSKLPATLRDLNAYPFYRTLDDGRTTRPLRTDFQQDKEPYYNRLSQLVQHIAERLSRSMSDARAHAVAHAGTEADQTKRSVLLLDVTDDLLERRAQLKDYLEQEGIAVLPAKRYSRDDMDLHRVQMLEDLARSQACVQFVGGLTGDRTDHPRGMAWLRCETIRNSGSAVPFLQWRDPDLDVSSIVDADARELIAQPSVRTDRFPDFRRAIAELALKPPEPVDPRLQQGMLSVFVNSDLLDRDLGTGVAQWLETRGFMVLEPPQVTQDAREEWETSVKYCDSLLLVYGQTKPAWVRTQILLSNKVQREMPLDLLSVCVGPPLPPQSREKLDALGLRYPGIYYMQVEDSHQLNPSELERFANRLREAHAHV
jgi:TIR domain